MIRDSEKMDIHSYGLMILDSCPADLLEDGRLSHKYAFSEFFFEMAGMYDRVSVAIPHRNMKDTRKFSVIEDGGVTFYLIPLFSDPADFFRKLPLNIYATLRGLWRSLDHCEVCLLRFPSPVLPFIYIFARLRGRHVVLFVKGTWLDTADAVEPSLKGLMKKAVVRMYEVFHRAIIKRHLTITTYPYMDGGLSNVIHAFISPFKKEDIPPRRELRDGTGKRRQILFVGRLSESKGIFVLLKAFEELCAGGYDVQLNVAGEGYLMDDIRELVTSIGLSDRVTLRGHVKWDGLKELYENADVFVLPSFTEGVPKVIFEAMVYCVPSVATRVGALPLMFTNGEHCRLVDPGDNVQLTAAIRSILDDPALARRLALNAYEKCSKFNLTNTSGNLAGLIEKSYTMTEGTTP